MSRALREHRLGSRMRHDRWPYTELFSVTLLLIWWSAMFRVVWVLFMLVQPGDLGLSWLDAPAGGPSILAALAIVEIGLLAMTAACFVEARNRTRLGLAIGAFNLSFVLALSGATFLHGSFARQLSAHRTSGAPSEWNLARGLGGEWQVVERLEPDGAPRFPAHAMTFDFFGPFARVGVQGPAPDFVEAWGTVRSTEAFVPRTHMFERLRRLVDLGRPVPYVEPLLPAHGPFLQIGVIRRAEPREMPGGGECFWSGQVSDANTDRLELRLTYVDLVKDLPDARVWLQRVRRHEAGRDLAPEPSETRRSLWW